jgi:hypothetical protein
MRCDVACLLIILLLAERIVPGDRRLNLGSFLDKVMLASGSFASGTSVPVGCHHWDLSERLDLIHLVVVFLL